MTSERYTEMETELRENREDLVRRLAAIRDDRRRQSAPLDHNLDDQAIQRENDAALDALDGQGRRELQAIDAALERIASGTYGQCLDCTQPISMDRLHAYPIATRCIGCSRGESAA